MRLIGKFLFLLLLAAAAFGVYWFWIRTPGDRELIASRLDELCTELDKPENESVASMLLKANGIARFFSDPVGGSVVLSARHADFPDSWTAEDIRSNYAMFHKFCTRAHFSFADLQIELNSPESASTRFTAIAEIDFAGGEPFKEAMDVRCDWFKVDNQWLIGRFSARPILH